MPADLASAVSAGSDNVEVELDNGTVRLSLPDGDNGHGRRVSVRVIDGSGAVLVDAARQAGFKRTQPNGPVCPPICWLAEVAV